MPDGPGPHGYEPTTGAVEMELAQDAGHLQVYPSPLRPGETATVKAITAGTAAGRLLIFDARGRTIRLLRPRTEGGGVTASWDGRDGRGERAPSGVYFLRWEDGTRRATGKVLVMK